MKKLIFILLVFVLPLAVSSQQTITLTFTAIDSTSNVQLDSIKVMNRTYPGDTVLYWPDTVLSIYNVGTPEISKGDNSFQVFQNYPNPVADQTTISMYVPEKDKVIITVTDILGRMIVQTERVLDKGKHSFRFTPGNSSLYFFSARWQGQGSSIKILQAGFHFGGTAVLEYTGSEDYFPQLKAIEAIQDFYFGPGDELLYIGYANGLESGILDTPEESQAYTFQFATNIPCPGTPTVEYEGQVYNTIQIFSQCWLKENLNVGTRINGSEEMTDNDVIEKYCYDDDPANCDTYGGLYQWDEMMQYTTQPGTQGICPPGWHVATDEEWKILEGTVDSQYGVGDPEWDDRAHRGYDAGKNLKTTSGWYVNWNSTDAFGFSGLPGGYRNDYGYFDVVGYCGRWWTSTEDNYYDDAWFRDLYYDDPRVYRNAYPDHGDGFSLRCLRDY